MPCIQLVKQQKVSKYRSQSKGFTTVILAVDEKRRVLKVRLETEDGLENAGPSEDRRMA